MEKLVSALGASSDSYRKRNDDDFADRLSSKYTVGIIIVFALVTTGAHVYGNTITCWVPTHFHGSWTKFSQSYCWVKNTYYLPWANNVPLNGDVEADQGKEYVRYYQWIPFILLVQAMLFYFPTVIWHGFNSKGGIDADNVLESAHTLSNTSKAEQRETTLKHVCNSMDRFLKSRKKDEKCGCDVKSMISATLCRPCGRRFGNYLILLYIFSKLIYIANVLGQFFLLDAILGTRFSSYGLEVFEGIEAGHNWDQADRVAFPRVTLCDFSIRRLGNANRYTVQCVLPINMYNEKIYIFLWFWMVFVLFVSVCSLITWLIRFIYRGDRIQFIQNHLHQLNKTPTEREVQLMHRFLDSYLKQDGAFLLRLIAHNTNNITVTEITCGLWDIWQERDLNRSTGFEDTGGLGSSTEKIPLNESLAGSNTVLKES